MIRCDCDSCVFNDNGECMCSVVEINEYGECETRRDNDDVETEELFQNAKDGWHSII